MKLPQTIVSDKPIIGIPFAAPLSGKDTAERGLTQTRSHIAIIHMSTLLKLIIVNNDKYKEIVKQGGLLPPEEAVKAFRRGFLEITRNTKPENLPHIFANGACREEYETKANIATVRRIQKNNYQQVGFRFLLDKEQIRARAADRVKQTLAEGKKPRHDDLGDIPVIRYHTFHKNLGPVLRVFEEKGGIIVDIDANETPEKVLFQITSVYDKVKLPLCVTC
jgi:hypothetical protein